jgi:hypothetical protein
MTRIVTTRYPYKRPPRKRKAVPLEGPAIARLGRNYCRADNQPLASEPNVSRPAIVTMTDRKLTKRRREEGGDWRIGEPAWLARRESTKYPLRVRPSN